MHPRPQNMSEGAVGSESVHCHSAFFLPFSPDNKHLRSLSLNDIGCRRRPNELPRRGRRVRSPSSDEALEAAARTCTYPLVPCQPPLFQSLTPHGLPEFGTREAQELRLIPPSSLHQFVDGLHRRFCRVEHNQMSNRVNERDGGTNAQQQDGGHRVLRSAETPATMLRRVMGTVIPVAQPSHPPRRASLPRGIITVSQPGPLTQADDGSQVRGRFGSRASGHGVGSRTISGHRLARLRESSALQNAVEAIEKACARDDVQQRGDEHVTRPEQRQTRYQAQHSYPQVHAAGPPVSSDISNRAENMQAVDLQH